jgi:tetratricopeptide (TPR) repeat protein
MTDQDMTDQYKYDVFVSYCSGDKHWVRGELLNRLEAARLRVLIDFRDFQPGVPNIIEIERGIKDSRKTLVVLTPAYVASQWCEMESVMLQTLSPSNCDRRLIPLLRTSCDKPLRLGALTYVDFTDEADIDLAWQRLLSALNVAFDAYDDPLPADIKAEHDKAKALLASDKHAEAMPILAKVLGAADGAGHARARVEIHLSLAHCLYDVRDDFSGAEKIYREALTLVPDKDHALKRSVLFGLGEMLLLAGRLDEAAAIAAALDESAKKSGKKLELAYSLMLRGHLEHSLGFNPRAVATLGESIGRLLQHSIASSGEDQRNSASALAICYLNKASMSHEEGRVEEALALCDLAAEQHRISGDHLDAGKALVFRGDILCTQAEWEKSFQSFQQAMKLFLEIGSKLWMARVAGRVADMHVKHGRWQEAVAAMLAAADGAAEAAHAGEQVHFLCEAAALVRQWKRHLGQDEALRQLLSLGNGAKGRASSDLCFVDDEKR